MSSKELKDPITLEELIKEELKDPITLDVLSDPILVPCCGQAFSRESLTHIYDRTSFFFQCPLCKANLSKDHSNFNPHTTPRSVALASLIERTLSNQRRSGGDRGGENIAASVNHYPNEIECIYVKNSDECLRCI